MGNTCNSGTGQRRVAAHSEKQEISRAKMESLRTPTPTFSCDDFPFENVIFEGGGNKGIAHAGAVRLLEEVGIWKNVRRLAGTSSGAMTAALLAVGYNSYELEEFLAADLEKIFSDHKLGYLSLLPNLVRGYGWNTGKGLYSWFGKKLAQATNLPEVTFRQVYEMFGRELCIVVTNLSQMSTEYCHVKTTPDMPVRLAVRMSMAIPAFFQPVHYKRNNRTEMFVDGGLLCNYPIHCFDGWWLSTQDGDHFLQRVQPINYLQRVYDDSDRFEGFNEKTIGILLYSANENEIFKNQLEARMDNFDAGRLPDTKLARMYLERRNDIHCIMGEQVALAASAERLIDALKAADFWTNKSLPYEDFRRIVLDKALLSDDDIHNIFGDEKTIQQIFDDINSSGGNELRPGDVSLYLGKRGLDLRQRYTVCNKRVDIKNLTNFLLAVQDTTLLNAKRLHVRHYDVERTIGINTHYVDTLDFQLTKEDKHFLIEQGRLSAIAFLHHYCERKASLENEKTKQASAGGDNVLSRNMPSGFRIGK